MLDNPSYASMQNLGVAAFVLLAVLLITRYGRGFLANISVLPGIVAGCILAAALGLMNCLFNTFPYTSFSQNVGLVGVTGVKSRWVCVAAGVIMIVLGLLPKMAALVESVPRIVLGGAGIVMFGMVAATGIRILSNVDFKGNR